MFRKYNVMGNSQSNNGDLTVDLETVKRAYLRNGERQVDAIAESKIKNKQRERYFEERDKKMVEDCILKVNKRLLCGKLSSKFSILVHFSVRESLIRKLTEHYVCLGFEKVKFAYSISNLDSDFINIAYSMTLPSFSPSLSYEASSPAINDDYSQVNVQNTGESPVLSLYTDQYHGFPYGRHVRHGG